jgi:hypothetical protein
MTATAFGCSYTRGVCGWGGGRGGAGASQTSPASSAATHNSMTTGNFSVCETGRERGAKYANSAASSAATQTSTTTGNRRLCEPDLEWRNITCAGCSTPAALHVTRLLCCSTQHHRTETASRLFCAEKGGHKSRHPPSSPTTYDSTQQHECM